jgi:NAD(P)-dependent dehydrogenase (short-subunit alcohol dehydrogenase family)
MARIFITGSSDGLGSLAAGLLVRQGHRVVLHARSVEKGMQAMSKVPGAESVLAADLSVIDEIKRLASDVNEMGSFDAVIHNAGIYNHDSGGSVDNDFIRNRFTVNTLAPYLLTCMIKRPERLIYLSSRMHLQGNPDMEQLAAMFKGVSHYPTYSDTKLHVLILSKAVARMWPGVYANALEPGWVPTKMGGPGAPDSLELGYKTQAWLAVSHDPQALVTGQYFYHQKKKHYLADADNIKIQDRFMEVCGDISGVRFRV